MDFEFFAELFRTLSVDENSEGQSQGLSQEKEEAVRPAVQAHRQHSLESVRKFYKEREQRSHQNRKNSFTRER